MKTVVVKTALLCAIAGSAAFGGNFGVDVSHSSIGFSIKHLMVSNVKGKFKQFDGNFSLDEKTMKLTGLEGIAAVKTVDTDIEKRDNHLKSADFFDAEKHPSMKLVMTKYVAKGKKGKLTANLTIKDKTKSVVFDVIVGGVATDPWGTKKAGLEMSAVINRKDFGLNWNKTLEAGGFVVGDEVKIAVELEGNEK